MFDEIFRYFRNVDAKEQNLLDSSQIFKDFAKNIFEFFRSGIEWFSNVKKIGQIIN